MASFQLALPWRIVWYDPNLRNIRRAVVCTRNGPIPPLPDPADGSHYLILKQ